MAGINPNEITFSALDSPSALLDIDLAWNDLWSKTPDATLFSSPNWLQTWIQVFWQPNWKMTCLAGFHNSDLCFLAPIYVQPGNSRASPTIALPLGQGEPEEMEVATEYLDFLIAPGYEAIAYPAIRDWILGLDFDVLSWRAAQLDSHARSILEVMKNQNQSPSLAYRVDKMGWSFEELGRSTKNRWKRTNNQIRRLDGRFFWIHGSDQDELWPTLSNLHQSNWRSKGQFGAFHSPDFSSFHDNFRRLTHQNSSCMSCLEVDGTPVAINYYFIGQDTLYFYQSGWDLNFSKISPGLALHLWSIIDCEYRYYDFMLGDDKDSYKKRFGCSEIPMVNIQLRRNWHKIFLSKMIMRLRALYQNR